MSSALIRIQHLGWRVCWGVCVVVLWSGCSLPSGGGSQGTGLSLLGGGTTGSGLSAPVFRAHVEGALRDLHGKAMFGVSVTIESLRSSETVTTDRTGRFAADVECSANEQITLRFSGPGLNTTYVVEQPVEGDNLLSLTVDRSGKILNSVKRRR